MGVINVLDFQVANLIAAGEVVERPASCVKELLENSVDAGATDITVEIQRGGIALIRVADNGCGISREDLPVAIKRHATSKIHSADDLDGIITLGFRGEALAAIASVSRMRIMTKRSSDSCGSLLCSEYGKVTDVVEIGAKNGTTVIIEDLFSNVPARRKFLKRDVSEAMAVTAIVEKIAISRPDIAVKLIIDGSTKFASPGDKKLISAVYAVLGRDFSSKLLKVRAMTEGIEVIGYISRPDSVRANRNSQNFFINSRYIKSRTATAALEQAFSSYCEVGKFPSCVLFINVHPSLVDVNVHPTKLEVKFSNEKAVFDAVYCAVRNTLSESDERPEILLEPKNISADERALYNAFVPVEDRIAGEPTAKLTQRTVFEKPTIYDVKSDTEPEIKELAPPSTAEYTEMRDRMTKQAGESTVKSADKAEKADGAKESKARDNDAGNDTFEKEAMPLKKEDAASFLFGLSTLSQTMGASDTDDEGMIPKQNSEVRSEPDIQYRIIGVAFNAYIFVETGEKTMIIDKHAAHERILFEDMKQIMTMQTHNTQMLLLPLTMKLSADEFSSVSEYCDELCSAGFEFEIDNGKRAVTLTQIPAFLSADDASDMFTVIAGRLADGTGSVEATKAQVFEKALYQASCKAAMKAGRVDDKENMKWIVERILTMPNIKYCPHGRPVAFELSKSDIEKFFKRT